MFALVRAGLHHMQFRDSAHEGLRPDDAEGPPSTAWARAVGTIVMIEASLLTYVAPACTTPPTGPVR